MRRVVLTCIAILAALGAFAQTRAERIRARLLDPNDSSVLVIAHRGAWRVAPENTIESIEKAVEIGVDIVEIDIRKTLDGQLILHHDPVLFRPSGSPTLEEALLASKGKVMLNLDKAFKHFDEVMEIVERTGTMDQIILKSSRTVENAVKVLGKYNGRVLYMPIINLNLSGALAKVEAFVQKMDSPMYELTFNNDSNPVLTIVQARLLGRSRLWYDTLWPSLCDGHDDDASLENHDNGYGWLIDNAGAGAIQTDRPVELIDYLKSRNLWMQ